MKILISGAGIAGLTLAYWLKRHGFTPTIVEKHPFLRKGGYKVDVRGTALEVAKRMGIHQTLLEKNVNIKNSQFVTSHHKVYQFQDDILGQTSEGDIEINRWDLCQIILTAIGEIEIIYNESITQLDEWVHFERMKPRAFDVVIGADGLYSNVRRLAFGEDSNFLKETGIHFCVFPTSNIFELESSEIVYLEKGKLIAAYSVANNSFAALAFKGDDKRLPREHLEKLFEEQFKDSGWETPRIIQAMKACQDCYFGSISQVRMPSWSKGRVALVGDAAHAAHGVATSLAMIGAYVLAREIKHMREDYAAAFDRYEQSIRKHVERGQNLSESNYQILLEANSSWLVRLQLYLMNAIPAKYIRFLSMWERWRMRRVVNAIVLED